MRVIIVLGSGASTGAGMPSVTEITEQVLSGDRTTRHGDDYRIGVLAAPSNEPFRAPVEETVRTVRQMRDICDSYFGAHDKPRLTNYEDIAYVAGQIRDTLSSEYENPALNPLVEDMTRGGGYDTVRDRAGDVVGYIEDVVTQMLSRPGGPFGHLRSICDAFLDERVEQLDLFTLNHDLVIDKALREAAAPFSDGFGQEHGSLRIWNDNFQVPTRRVFKLHGAIDWFRYPLTIGGWNGQVVARSSDGDPFHPRGPAEEDLGFPALGRPQVLTGTFNKILSYQTGIFDDQHVHFHDALRDADRLIVTGYGFRDKAINARLVAWAERPGKRRLLVIHPNPQNFAHNARGAVRGKWERWQDANILRSIESRLTADVTWGDLRANSTSAAFLKWVV
jgi:hypothetical protein